MSVSRTIRSKPTQQTNNITGILWALVATALFSSAAAIAKIAVADYHVFQILFFRQVIVFASSLPSIKKSFPHSLKTRYPGIHLVRLLGAFVALTCGIWSVAFLPLTTATTLTFAQVFFVAILALVFLKEAVGLHRFGAVLVGFLGVIVVMRPGVDGLVNVYAFIPIAGAFGAAVAITSVRKLAATDSTATLLVYQALFVGILAGVPLYWVWVTPDFSGLLLLLSMGVLATAGQWAAFKSLRWGEASVVGPIEYSKLIYAAILGFVLFKEIPDGFTITGAFIIISSSIYIYHREAKIRAEQNHHQRETSGGKGA